MEDNYSKLANAVIIQAVKDYRGAYSKMLMHPGSKTDKDEVIRQEKFFLSEWFTALTDVDGRKLLQKIQMMEQKKFEKRRKAQ
jgi:hypothetical protein